MNYERAVILALWVLVIILYALAIREAWFR
jgi:hypothetical protein